METLNAISDRIERLLLEWPDGLDAYDVVSELTNQGVAGDDAAAALAAGLGDRRWQLDSSSMRVLPVQAAARV